MTTKIYVPGAYNYVTNSNNNQKIKEYANALGIPPAAVAAAIIKEHDAYLVNNKLVHQLSDLYAKFATSSGLNSALEREINIAMSHGLAGC